VDTSRYAELFLTESREHLSLINHTLLQMERSGASADTVGALFRSVHTVKGMSATMGYDAVAELAHALEALMERVRREELRVTSSLMDALFAAADTLEWSIESAVTGRPDDRSAAAVRRLREYDAPTSPPRRGQAGSARRSGQASRHADVGRGTPRGVDAVEPVDGSPDDSGASGRLVRVRIAADAALPGVRAVLALGRARQLGPVSRITPPERALGADAFDGEIRFRLETTATPDVIATAIRRAGDIAAVEVDGQSALADGDPAARSEPATGALGAPSFGSDAAGRKQRHVRIDLRRLDALMNLIGELVITRGRLVQLSAPIANPALDESIAQMSRLVADLQAEIMTCRMVPVWQIFDRFPRLVRDAARTLGKQVDFAIDGREIELDRSMLDEIGDPIVHLLRNAVDHGIEAPDAREAAGKPPVGRLTLSASRDRSAVLIRVSDDGRGIDRDKVLQRAKATGLIDGATTELGDDELMRLISRPGFSTADAVTEISGRGVGIDAVQARVRALGGSVDIRTAPGQGTTVTARLPLTLAIMRALLARVGDEVYAVPMAHIRETIALEQGTRSTVQGRPVFVLRHDVLPLIHLREIVGLAPAAAGAGIEGGPDRGDWRPDETGDGEQVLILELLDRAAALVVDALPGQQEIVVKQFDGVRGASPLFSGATILGDGAPALIVDVSSLL
jgi:two-component system chemotaxis sensor kinase CheA